MGLNKTIHRYFPSTDSLFRVLFIYFCFNNAKDIRVEIIEFFCIHETLTLSTNAERSTDTNFFLPLKCRWSAAEVLLKCHWSALEVPLKCRGSALEVPTATFTDLPLLTPPLSSVGWSKIVCFSDLVKKGLWGAQTDPPFIWKMCHLRPILGIRS